MTESFIKSFSIYGLFGQDDVHLYFDENTKILVGENGIGKTQVLNILYYTITVNFIKLVEFTFDKVELAFKQKTIEIYQHEIKQCITGNTREIDFNQGSDKKQNIISNNFYVEGNYIAFGKAPKQYYGDLKDNYEYVSGKNNLKIELSPTLENFEQKIKNIFLDNAIVYFPTFRRVEEDLHNIGYEEDFFIGKDDSRLIHFGMDDVQKRFNAIEKKIDLLLKEGFTKISSEILSKLVKGFGDTNKKILDKISETDINIILARVGDQISDTEKTKIKEIVLNKENSNTDNSLLYFIQILVDIYEQQKEFDNSINRFKEVCNGYLIGKKVFYDESNIKIYIKSNNSSDPLPLSKLSSGEKQIISIFSKIYLSEDKRRFIVLFDEPELSLSMPWQRKLLPDILASNKCDFLLAVTHSPFIFDNELDRYAISLSEYIQPQDSVTA